MLMLSIYHCFVLQVHLWHYCIYRKIFSLVFYVSSPNMVTSNYPIEHYAKEEVDINALKTRCVDLDLRVRIWNHKPTEKEWDDAARKAGFKDPKQMPYLEAPGVNIGPIHFLKLMLMHYPTFDDGILTILPFARSSARLAF